MEVDLKQSATLFFNCFIVLNYFIYSTKYIQTLFWIDKKNAFMFFLNVIFLKKILRF